MEKFNIIIPTGIKYMSDWTDFTLPDHPHIMNKVVTGCGFTEYFLRPNPKYPRIILVSPRRILLENKEEQHNNPKDGIDIGKVYYAKNELEEVKAYDEDLTSKPKSTKKEEKTSISNEEYKKRIDNYKTNLGNYIFKRQLKGENIRIMVTYDSFRLVKEVLGEAIKYYQIVVDEFQSIFTDSKFKSSTEIELLHHLKDLQRVCFLSATPMLDEYLEKLTVFRDLPYYQLDWETLQPGRIHRPNLECKQTTSIVTSAHEIIQSYLDNRFERYSYRDGEGMIQEIYSKELVIYCNSVKNICDIIRKCGLRPEQCNILCSDTNENRLKINQAFKVVDPDIPTRGKNYIGSVPQKGEPHKMFTFCTRTVYLGADFYSTNARSLILSDANIDCLSVDISMDLPQILGRQRLTDINPWANSAIFRFKTNTKEIPEEEFRAKLDKKIKKTENLLKVFESAPIDTLHDLAENYQIVAKVDKYKDQYVSVNTHMGSDLKPCFNELILIAEQRTFDIQKVDYKDRFSVLAEVNQEIGIDSRSRDINDFLINFEKLGLGKEKMRYLCEFLKVRKDLEEEILMNIPLAYKNYFTVLGPERCWNMGYQMSKLEYEYKLQLNNQRVSMEGLLELIYSTFLIGERYTKSDLKKTIQGIYDHLGLQKTGKASDFEEWFEMKRVNLTNPETKKRQEGYQLIKRKYSV